MVRPLTTLVPLSGHHIRKGKGATGGGNNRDEATRSTAPRRSSAGAVAPTNPTSFGIDDMPKEKISPRTLHNSSVHYSVSANKWITTIDMGDRLVLSLDDVHRARRNTLTFPFDDERSARKFCNAYAPPKMVQPATNKPSCAVCHNAFALKGKKEGTGSGVHSAGRPYFAFCRNCGVPVCPANSKRGCSTTWAVTMLPKTYTMNENLTHVSVCSSCDWLSNAFCVALLKGRLDDVKTLFRTGNVNLRCSFADINGEAMFPVHCAVMGGNLQILKWLVDGQCVPISVERRSGVGAASGYSEGHRTSVLTSKGRSVLDLSVVPGRRRMEIVRYLVVEKQMSLVDAKNSKMALSALEGYLREGHQQVEDRKDGHADVPTELTGGGLKTFQSVRSDDESSSFVQSVEDPCVLCYERSMADCVLIPCGHQMCCFECGQTLSKCPVCSKDCSVLRVFRP